MARTDRVGTSSVDQASDDQLIALTRDRAADLAGIASRRLSAWVRSGLALPSVVTELSGTPVTLFDFGDLVALLVAEQLINQPGVSVQQVRRLVGHLRERGHERPLRELRFAIKGGEIYVQSPDGTWSGDRVPDQIVIHQVIHLEPLRARIRSSVGERDESAKGQVRRRRGVLGSQPVLAGTRIPVETLRRYVAHGFDDAHIMRSFPGVTSEDLAAVRRAA